MHVSGHWGVVYNAPGRMEQQQCWANGACPPPAGCMGALISTVETLSVPIGPLIFNIFTQLTENPQLLFMGATW